MKNKSNSGKAVRILLTVAIILAVASFSVACNTPGQQGTKPDDETAFGEWQVQKEATCVEDGLRYRTNKKGERQEEIIPATGHSYGAWSIVNEATYLEEGLKQSVCSRCNDRRTKIISALVDGTNGLEYTYWESEDVYYITGSGDALEVKDLIVPTSYKGKTVIYVYKDSLINMPNLETVTFADNSKFEYIYSNAFKGCKKLKSIYIPSSVTYLPADFASNCNALEQINIDSNSESFCSVDGVVYTKDITSLVAYPQAKQGVYTVPATLNSITYKDIFKNTNYPLATAFGISAFAVEQGNTCYAVDAKGALYSNNMKTLCAYPLASKADELVIDSEDINKIDSYAFANNKYLNSVKVINGSGYKTLNGYAFYNTSVKTLELEGFSSCESYAIYGNDLLQNVIFSTGNASNFGLDSYGIIVNTSLKKVVLPYALNESYSNGVLCCDDPFWGCSALEEVAIEQGGECAYVAENGAIYTKDMTCLMFIPHAKTAFTLPNTLKTINTTALKYNETFKFETENGLKYYQNWVVGVVDDEITSVVVKEGTVGIAAKALSGLTLEKLSLPESLKYVSYMALAKITPTEFIYHNNFEYIENSAFSQFGFVGGVIDLGTPSFIGDYALSYTKFAAIKVGFKNTGNSTVIEKSSALGAFYSAKADKLYYGPYVTEIGKNACNKMTNLLEVFIASQAICDNHLYFPSTGSYTHYKSVTKVKWIASGITLSEKTLSAIESRTSNFHLEEGVTTTVDGITYDKYSR